MELLGIIVLIGGRHVHKLSCNVFGPAGKNVKAIFVFPRLWYCLLHSWSVNVCMYVCLHVYGYSLKACLCLKISGICLVLIELTTVINQS